MPIIRIQRKESGFALIPNYILEDERLSFEARGMLCYLLSRPENLTVRGQDLTKCLIEIQKAGYAALEPTLDESGNVVGKTWLLYEDPAQNPHCTDSPKAGSSGEERTV